MYDTYSHTSTWLNGISSCQGSFADIEARRASTGLYYVRFPGNPAQRALAISNSDNSGSENSAVRDNIVSVARIFDSTSYDNGAFRVQVEDVTGTGTGTAPTDGWFTIVAF
jgi:hypothetical protein